MPGERAFYRKIQVVLDFAKEGKHDDRETLVRRVVAHRPANFVYSWRDRDSDEIKYRCSEKSVEGAVELCIDLGLLAGESVAMSKRGLNATDPRRFATIVGVSTREFLERRGVSLAAITSAIGSLLRAKHAVPPTVDEVWNHLGQPEDAVAFEDFRRLMALMGQCGVLFMTQRRIYLPARM